MSANTTSSWNSNQIVMQRVITSVLKQYDLSRIRLHNIWLMHIFSGEVKIISRRKFSSSIVWKPFSKAMVAARESLDAHETVDHNLRHFNISKAGECWHIYIHGRIVCVVLAGNDLGAWVPGKFAKNSIDLS